MRAPTCSSAPPRSKGFLAFWAPSACAASATCYPSCSAAPLPWPSAFSWVVPVFKSGRPFWPSGLTLRSSGRLRRRLPWLLVPSPALCAQPLVPALYLVQGVFKPFWPPALASQAPPAIILAALRRFRGPAVFLGLRTSSRLGAPFWPSGLTLRSSGPAFCGPLTLAVRHHE